MTKLIFKMFYVLPLHNIIGFMALLIFAWWLMYWSFKKYNRQKFFEKFVNRIIFIFIVMVIIAITIVSRNGGSEVILTPFHSFVEARVQPEMYRSMLMNVFLFFPFGLTLPYALPEKWRCHISITILFALIFSVSIEYSQYYFSLGRAETDDVICNTLGCTIGTISYWLSNVRDKKGISSEE